MTLTILFALVGPARAQHEPPPGTCLGGSCPLGAQVARPERDAARPSRGFARGAAWFGTVSAALSLAGAITIAAVDDPHSERVTRGIWLGYNVLAVPLIALGSYTTRKRAKVEGYRGIRILGWTAYSSMVPLGVAQWVGAFREADLPKGISIGIGAMALLTYLPHAFDAYVVGRQARIKGLARVRPTPFGLSARF